ncbi:MAG: hypothetical protein GY906_24095 [bacterium]|nr:hypothetical protein [bacterium]
MRAVKFVLVALLTAGPLALTACESIPKEVQLIQACQNYSRVLATLAGFKAEGRLTAPQIEAVEGVRTFANPICENGEYVTIDLALDTIENKAIEDLMAIHGDAQ